VTLVVDAGVVVAAMTDGGDDGEWARRVLTSGRLAAPHLMPVEAANILRRAVHSGGLSNDAASLAHGDLLALPVELFPYHLLADRIWELRPNVTCYDGWYVALAELMDAPLATLDVKLSRAPGIRCEWLIPS
jgi:predicted nucleic acid-binding protein